MDGDIRYDRDVYTWLSTLELSQYYFLFKAASLLKVRDVLYLEEEDLEKIGIEDEADLRKLMLGIQHMSVPDRMLRNRKYSTVFQTGRLIVHIHRFLPYSQVVANTLINHGFLDALRTGIKELSIVSPLAKKADIWNILWRFRGLQAIKCVRFFEEGMNQLGRALVEVTTKREGSSILRELDLAGADMGDEGCKFLCAAITAGACPILEHLDLSYNKLKPKGMASLAKAIRSERLKRVVHLSLTGNGLGDAGVSVFANSIASPNLKSLEILDMAGVQMTDKGLFYLAQALKPAPCPELREIDLRNNVLVKDGGCVSIMSVIEEGLPALELLRLRGCRCSMKTAQTFMDFASDKFDLTI